MASLPHVRLFLIDNILRAEELTLRSVSSPG
jgi:hypothetical protein